MPTVPGVPEKLAELDRDTRDDTHGFLATTLRVLTMFAVLSGWCLLLSLAGAYAGTRGLIAWLRLPDGLGPARAITPTVADVGALAALFIAILLAATVQLNAVVGAADDIAAARPADLDEEIEQRGRLRFYGNQAEISMIVSYTAAVAVLFLAVLYGLGRMAALPASHYVDGRGVGWAGFAEALPALLDPGFIVLYLVALLLFLTTWASMPEWKNTGIFQRQVEGNALDAARRLRRIAARHDLDDVTPVTHPGWALTAAVTGYLLYVVTFALLLNLSLATIVGGERFEGFFSAGHRALFLVFVVLAVFVSVAVGSAMLWVHDLHGSTNVGLITSILLGVAGLVYVMTGEGVAWAVAVALIVVAWAVLWAWLYWRAADVLDAQEPRTWEYLLNPPKFIVVRRYEAIRRSAARVTTLGP